MTTKIISDLEQDDRLVQDADYRFDPIDRQYIDEQALGAQQHLVDALIRGKHATYYRLDGASAAVQPGDLICSASNSLQTHKRITADLLASAKAVTGVVIFAAAPGSWVLTGIGGQIPQTITGLTIGNQGSVRANTTTGRCERVDGITDGDYAVGVVDAAGNLQISTGISTVAAGAGEINTGSNVGTGARIFKDKNGVDFRHRRVLGLNSTSVLENVDTVEVNADAGEPLTYTASGTLNDVVGVDSNGRPAPVIRFTGGPSVTGITGGAGRRRPLVIAAVGNDVTLTHEDTGSIAGNRFFMSSGSSTTIAAGSMAIAAYDDTDLRWRVSPPSDGGVGQHIRDTVTFPSDSDYTLSPSQSNADILAINPGVITRERTITSLQAPNASLALYIRNNNAFPISFRWSSGAPVFLDTGTQAVVGSDGVDAKALIYNNDISVRIGDYGGKAIPGYDNTAALNAAIAAAGPGGVVYFSNGYYEFQGHDITPPHAVSLRGQASLGGNSQTVLQFIGASWPAEGELVFNTPSAYSSVRDLSIYVPHRWGSIADWTNAHVYSVGDRVRKPGSNQVFFICRVAGTSGANHPFGTRNDTYHMNHPDSYIAEGPNTLVWEPKIASPIVIKTQVEITSCAITQGTTAGVHIQAGGDEWGPGNTTNANGSVVRDNLIYFSGLGVFARGENSNACKIDHNDITDPGTYCTGTDGITGHSGGRGVWDHSYLGCVVTNNHVNTGKDAPYVAGYAAQYGASFRDNYEEGGAFYSEIDAPAQVDGGNVNLSPLSTALRISSVYTCSGVKCTDKGHAKSMAVAVDARGDCVLGLGNTDEGTQYIGWRYNFQGSPDGYYMLGYGAQNPVPDALCVTGQKAFPYPYPGPGHCAFPHGFLKGAPGAEIADAPYSFITSRLLRGGRRVAGDVFHNGATRTTILGPATGKEADPMLIGTPYADNGFVAANYTPNGFWGYVMEPSSNVGVAGEPVYICTTSGGPIALATEPTHTAVNVGDTETDVNGVVWTLSGWRPRVAVETAGGVSGVDALDQQTLWYDAPKALTGNPNLTFAAAGDTITRAAGSWFSDGFAIGDFVTIAGSTSNNVSATITDLTTTVMTLDVALTNEGPSAGRTVTSPAKIRGTDRTVVSAADGEIDHYGNPRYHDRIDYLTDDRTEVPDFEAATHAQHWVGRARDTGEPAYVWDCLVALAVGSVVQTTFKLDVNAHASYRAVMTGNPNLTFAEVGTTGDTITRSGGSWITDGFAIGDVITVEASASNNVTGVIANLSATVITLDATDLIAEGPSAGITVTAPKRASRVISVTGTFDGTNIYFDTPADLTPTGQGDAALLLTLTDETAGNVGINVTAKGDTYYTHWVGQYQSSVTSRGGLYV